MGLPNGNNSGLRAQDCRHEVATANVSNTAHAEGAIVEVSLCQPAITRACLQVLQRTIYLQDALILHLFNIGDGEAIWAIDGD